MSLSTINQAVDRILHSQSRIAVFKNLGPDRRPLNTVFADTTHTAQLINDNPANLIGIFDGGSDAESTHQAINNGLNNA